MLGSNHDGERANAAALATSLLAKNGATWQQISVGRDSESSDGGSYMVETFRIMLRDERARTTHLSREIEKLKRRLKATEAMKQTATADAPPPGETSGLPSDADLRAAIVECLKRPLSDRTRDFLRSVSEFHKWSDKQREAIIKCLRWNGAIS